MSYFSTSMIFFGLIYFVFALRLFTRKVFFLTHTMMLLTWIPGVVFVFSIFYEWVRSGYDFSDSGIVVFAGLIMILTYFFYVDLIVYNATKEVVLQAIAKAVEKTQIPVKIVDADTDTNELGKAPYIKVKDGQGYIFLRFKRLPISSRTLRKHIRECIEEKQYQGAIFHAYSALFLSLFIIITYSINLLTK